jgi:hypothetical protein
MDVQTAIGMAWNCSKAGRQEDALGFYRQIDAWLPTGRLNPELSLLRHNVGSAPGRVVPIPPNENDVLSVRLESGVPEHDDAYGLELPAIDHDLIIDGIQDVIEHFDPDYHRQNIAVDLPHVFVMSTGRCGTVSMFRLFERTQYLPYHTYWYHVSYQARLEMMCAMLYGRRPGDGLMREWCETRAAEWIGCVNEGRPMMALNHLDTIWAPVFAALHPKSKFIWLRREPEQVFRSMFSKRQWGTPEWGGEVQLQPILCRSDPFTWRRPGYDQPDCIAWFIRFTEVFARAMREAVGLDRFEIVSADDLFSLSDGEHDPQGVGACAVSDLRDFTGADIDLVQMSNHFETPINHKAHKVVVDGDQLEMAVAEFSRAYDRVARRGAL